MFSMVFQHFSIENLISYFIHLLNSFKSWLVWINRDFEGITVFPTSFYLFVLRMVSHLPVRELSFKQVIKKIRTNIVIVEYYLSSFIKKLQFVWDGAVVARWAHNPKVGSSSLSPAPRQLSMIDMKLFRYSGAKMYWPAK